MKISGTAQVKSLAQQSKTPREELRVKCRGTEYTLRHANQVDVSKIDPAFKDIHNKAAEFDGHRIAGTKVFVVKSFKVAE